MPASFTPTTPELLASVVAEFLDAVAADRPLRVAVDGPRAGGPVELAAAVTAHLRGTGRPASTVDAASFWRDASLRLEFGRTDVESYARDWLDVGALTREVLDPLGPGGSGQFLPALRDPLTNRSVRTHRRRAAPNEIVLIAGELLLGRGLRFDAIVHVSLSASARARRTPPEWAWTLPAHDGYDATVDPVGAADLVVRGNDPAHPAVLVRRRTD